MSNFNIAIDGPSGVGKSTIADKLAEQLGMKHLDTGAMYRCVTYYMLQNNVDTQDEQALQDALNHIQIEFIDDKVFLNKEDVTTQIRTNEISMATSKVASIPLVRKHLVVLQQETTKNKGFIVDGRDICSVVLPDAEVKIYMDASAKARADRRYNEYVSKNIEADYQEIYDDIIKRDYQDSHREISPLKKADDATLVDTSDLSIDEVVDTIMHFIQK